MSFSGVNRAQSIQSLSAASPEVLIIGGGAVGCAIAARASELGLRCAVLERQDLASGSSGNSTGLAHAGLRYLAQGRVLYVFHESRERQRLEELAPQWVRPFDFLLPVYQDDPFSFSMVRLGTWLYDLLGRLNAWFTHRVPARSPRAVPVEELLGRVPGLDRRGLQGGMEYFVDAQLQDSRFTLGLAQKAARTGAHVITYAEVRMILPYAKGGYQVRYMDTLSGQMRECTAPLIINASGAWIDRVRGLVGLTHPIVRASRGIHLIVDRIIDSPLIFSTEIKGKVFFVLPLGNEASLVGTTDTATEGSPEASLPQPQEIRELIQRLFRFFPYLKHGENLAQAVDSYKQVHVRSVTWGDRPLLRQSGTTLHASRDSEVVDDLASFWSIPGVKLTAARAVGDELTRRAWKTLRKSPPPDIPESILPGGEFSDYASFVTEAQRRFRLGDGSDQIVAHLVAAYGTRYKEIVAWAQEKPHYGERVLPDEPWILAEAAHAAQEEMVLTLNDFLWRRTKWAHLREIPDLALHKIAGVLADVLSWGPEEVEAQMAAYREERKKHRV